MEQNTNKEFYPDFFLVPRAIWLDTNIPPMAEKVYAVIYWYGKLKDGYCHASNAAIAKNIGSTNSTSVTNAIAKLIEHGYVAAEYEPKTGARQALVPLIEFTRGVSSNDEGGHHQTVIHNKNNIEKKSYVVDFEKSYKELPEIHKLYSIWLIHMVIGTTKWFATGNPDRRSLLESAAKQTKLTEKRYKKLSVRLEDIGFDRCYKAIMAIGKSEWHKGENENKWKASLEWLFNSTERAEEWSNK